MTKRESNILKGIAVLLMLFHHLFGTAGRYAEYGFTGLIVNEDITLAVAKDLKVCVAIFAFISGHGMCKKTLKNNANKVSLAKFGKECLKAYWDLIKDICFLTFVLILASKIFGLSKTPEVVWGTGNSFMVPAGVIANMTGTAGFFEINWFVSSWWYIEIAILFIVLFLPMYMLMKKIGGGVLLIVSIVFIPYIFKLNVSQDTIWRYLPAFLCGMVMADWEVVEKLRKCVNDKAFKKVIAIIGFSLLLVALVILKHTVKANFIIQSAQAVILAGIVILFITNIPVLAAGLDIFGRNSKYIWLIHVFIYGQLLQEHIFRHRNIWLIFGVLATISLLSAVVLKWLFYHIQVLVKKIYKHKIKRGCKKTPLKKKSLES